MYVYILGCPTKTCFFEIKKTQPTPVVFGWYVEGSQKDFWFRQLLGGAQGRQKSALAASPSNPTSPQQATTTQLPNSLQTGKISTLQLSGCSSVNMN